MDPTITLPSETGEVQPEQPIGNSQSLTPLIIFLFITIVVLGGLFTWLFLGSKKVAQPVGVNVAPTAPVRVGVAVSGIVYFQGYAPNGYYIAIAAREAGHTDYQDVISGITPDPDGTTEWSWKDATKGKNYDIKATL